jgi:hypothetical protein
MTRVSIRMANARAGKPLRVSDGLWTERVVIALELPVALTNNPQMICRNSIATRRKGGILLRGDTEASFV